MESDCSRVVEGCSDGILIPETAVIIDDILHLKLSFSRCGFLWTRRDANAVRHEVAAMSLSDNLNCDWCTRFPPSLEKDSA